MVNSTTIRENIEDDHEETHHEFHTHLKKVQDPELKKKFKKHFEAGNRKFGSGYDSDNDDKMHDGHDDMKHSVELVKHHLSTGANPFTEMEAKQKHRATLSAELTKKHEALYKSTGGTKNRVHSPFHVHADSEEQAHKIVNHLGDKAHYHKPYGRLGHRVNLRNVFEDTNGVEMQKIEEGNTGEDTLRPGGGSAGAGDKMQRIAGIVQYLTTLKADDLNGFEASLKRYDPADAVGSPAEGNKSSIAAKSSAAAVKQVVKEDLATIFGTEESLSEDFIDKATTLFEAAVSTRVAVELEAINEQAETDLAETTEKLVVEFSERLDSYLEYVAEHYVAENKIAIESGLKTELTENFVSGLHKLFAENYIDIPEDKVDVVASLTEEVEALTTRLNDAVNESISMREMSTAAARGTIVNALAEGMVEIDADRLKTLTEDLDYSDIEDFQTKATMLKESLFGAKSVSTPGTAGSNGLLIEEVGIVDTQAEPIVPVANARMNRYAEAIKKQVNS